MKVVGGKRPLAIRVFAAAFLAAAILRLVRGLSDIEGSAVAFALQAPSITWTRDLTITVLSAEFSIALIPLVWIYLFAARFARWLVLVFGALRLWFLDPSALMGAALMATAMASLLTAQANRWFSQKEGIDPAVFE
jgi:hypothetical protein